MCTYNVPEERVVNTIHMVSDFMKLIFVGKGRPAQKGQ